jgi:signal transduction histidine kinase
LNYVEGAKDAVEAREDEEVVVGVVAVFGREGLGLKARVDIAEEEVEGREWVMTIRDDGPGVPVEQQPRLFLPFFRVDDARNAKTGGTGLGLAIAAEAIQRHGGTIRASSNQPTGLVITIRLPMP